MAGTPGIEAALGSFKEFTKALDDFETTAKRVESAMVKMNSSFAGLANVFDNGSGLIRSIGTLADGINKLAIPNAKMTRLENVSGFLSKYIDEMQRIERRALPTESLIRKVGEMNVLGEGIKNLSNTLSKISVTQNRVTKLSVLITSISKVVTDLQTLNKRSIPIDSLTVKIQAFFESFKQVAINSISTGDISKLSTFSKSIYDLFLPIIALGKQQINVANIRTNIGAVQEFFNAFVGQTKAERAAKIIPQIASNLQAGSTVGSQVGNFLSLLNPDGILQRITTANFSAFRKLGEVTSALNPLIDFMTKLSGLTLNLGNVQQNIQSLNTFLTEFSGSTKAERGFSFFKDFFNGGYIQSIKSFVTGGNLLSNGIKSMGGVLNSSIVGGNSGLMSLFKPSGLIDQFSKFSSSKVGNFLNVTRAITNIANVMNSIKGFDIDPSAISKFKASLTQLTDLFLGKGKLETAFEGIQYFMNNFGSIKAKPLTGLSYIGEKLIPFLSGRNGLMGAIGNFDEKQVTAFARFSRSLVHIFNALEVVGKTTFNSDLVIENIKSVTQVFDLFTGKKFMGIFNQGGILSKFGGTGTDSFAKFADGLLKSIQSIAFMSKGSVDFASVKNFTAGLKDMVNDLSGINFKGASGIENFGKALEKIGKNISFGKGMNKAAYESGVDLAKNLQEGAEDSLEISSPSKVFIRMGKFVVSGLIAGLKGIDKAINGVMKFIVEHPKAAIAVGAALSASMLVGFVGFKLGSKIIGSIISDLKKIIPVVAGVALQVSRGVAKAVEAGYTVIKNFTNKSLSLIGQAGNKLVVGPITSRIKGYFSQLGSTILGQSETLGAKIGGMFDRLFGYNSPLTKFSFAFNNISQAFQKFGSGFDAAVDFETGLTDVFKTVDLDDLTTEQADTFVQGFADEIKRMATSSDSTVSGLGDAFGTLFNIGVQAGSAGVARENLPEFIKTIGELTLSSDLSAEAGTSQLASFATVTGTTEYGRLGSTIVELGNKFNATESQIVEFAQRLAGISSGTNLTQANILALSSSMASVGLNAEAGGSAMTQFIGSIIEANASMTGGEVSAEAYTASLQRNAEALAGDRLKALREIEKAQDQLNRATTRSSQITAEDKLAKWQGELAQIDAAVGAIEGRIAGAPSAGTITFAGVGSEELKTFAEVAGLSAQEFSTAWGERPMEVIQLLIDGFSQMTPEEQVRAFDDLGQEGIRLTDTIRRLAGAEGLLADSTKIANEAWKKNTALTEEAQKRNESGRSALNRLGNSAKLFKVELQNLFYDGFKDVINGLNDIIGGLTRFIVENKEIIRSVMPNVIKAVGLLSAGFLATSLNLTKLVGITRLLASPLLGMIGMFTKIVGLFFNPIGLIAAFAAVKFVPMLWQEMTDKTSGMVDVFGSLGRTIGSIFSGVFELVGVVSTLVTGLMNVKTEVSTGMTAIETFFSPILNFFDAINQAIGGLIDNLRLIGQAVGIDMGLESSAELANQREINTLVQQRLDMLAPKTSEGGTTATAATTDAYKILAGDTLTGIANQFGVSIADIMAANPLIENPNLIFAGKEIAIPIKLVDGDGNEITPETNVIENTITNSGDVEPWLLEMDNTIANMENIEIDPSAGTLIDRLEGLKDTDIFKNVFGDDENALGRAQEQLVLLEDSMSVIKQAGIDFTQAVTDFLSGNWEGALTNLKDAALGFGQGVADGLAALFGNTDGNKTFDATAGAAGRFSGQAASDMLKPMAGFEENSFFKSISDNFTLLGETLSFVDDLDLSGIQTFIGDIVGALRAFADPIIAGVIPRIENQIIPAIQQVLSIFNGEGENAIDTEGLQTLASVLGGAAVHVANFITAVVGAAANLAGSTVKLLIDLFSGVGILINSIFGDGESITTNDALKTYLLDPLLNFAENLAIGTLDAALGFLEALTGLELPTGEELFGSIINFFEDMVNRIKIGLLDLSIEGARATGNFDEMFRLVELRGFTGLSDAAMVEMQAALDSGVPIDLSKLVTFTYNGEVFTGTIGDILSGELGNMQDTATTSGNATLLETAKTLFEEFTQTGNGDTLGAVIDIYEMLGRPKLEFDPTKVDMSQIADAQTIASGLLARVFNFENLSVEDVNPILGVSDKIEGIIGEVFGQAIQDASLGTTPIERADAANNLLYSYIENSATLTEAQKTTLMDEVDRRLSEVYLGLTGVDLSAQGIGEDVTSGIVLGMVNNQPAVNQAGTDTANGLLGTMQEVLGIQSPSTKMITMGNDLVAGLIQGLAGTEESNLVTAIQTNLIDPFMSFDLAIQLVIISVQSLIDRLLLLGTTPGGDQVLPLIAGGRKYGGAVAAGNIYQVLEDKLPFEMYKTKSGKSYFMPNEDGEIISPYSAGTNSMKTEPKINNSTSNSNFYEIDQSIHVPVIFENAPIGATQAELDRLADNMSERIENRIKANAKKNTVNDRLTRRGYS
jgi:TP901 family phage tail tape measure protein